MFDHNGDGKLIEVDRYLRCHVPVKKNTQNKQKTGKHQILVNKE